MKKFHMLLQDTIRWSLVVIGAAILGGLWIWISAVPADATTGGLIPSPREGFLAPDFTLESLSSDQISLSDMRGKAVVLNLWGFLVSSLPGRNASVAAGLSGKS